MKGVSGTVLTHVVRLMDKQNRLLQITFLIEHTEKLKANSRFCFISTFTYCILFPVCYHVMKYLFVAVIAENCFNIFFMSETAAGGSTFSLIGLLACLSSWC